MRTVFVPIIVATLLLSFVQAQTQTQPPASDTLRVGIGVGLLPWQFPNNDAYAVQPSGVLSWYVPVQIGTFFRTQLEFAYFGANDSVPLTVNNNTILTRTTRQSTFLRFGVGVYYTHPVDTQTRFYGGFRSGFVSSSVNWQSFIISQNVTNLYNENVASFWLGLALGFEYLLTSHIALGAEIHLTNYTTGAPASSSPIPSEYPRRFTPGYTSNATLTAALIALRFFF
jgi:Outer membrane protein beta-barrel domain